jgi:hypothetical protein
VINVARVYTLQVPTQFPVRVYVHYIAWPRPVGIGDKEMPPKGLKERLWGD